MTRVVWFIHGTEPRLYDGSGEPKRHSNTLPLQSPHPDRSSTGGLAGKYYATRFLDFSISIEFPIAYLKEPLIRHRIHGDNQDLAAADDLMEAIGFYVLNIQFAIKQLKGLSRVAK